MLPHKKQTLVFLLIIFFVDILDIFLITFLDFLERHLSQRHPNSFNVSGRWTFHLLHTHVIRDVSADIRLLPQFRPGGSNGRHLRLWTWSNSVCR